MELPDYYQREPARIANIPMTFSDGSMQTVFDGEKGPYRLVSGKPVYLDGADRDKAITMLEKMR